MEIRTCFEKILYEIKYIIEDLLDQCLGEKEKWKEIPLEEIKVDKILYDYEEDWTRV